MLLANAACNELGVLGAKIDDQNFVIHHAKVTFLRGKWCAEKGKIHGNKKAPVLVAEQGLLSYSFAGL